MPTESPIAAPTAVPTEGSELCMYEECEIGGPRPCEAGTYCNEITTGLFQCTENDKDRGVPNPFSTTDGSQVCYPTVDGAYPGAPEIKVL